MDGGSTHSRVLVIDDSTLVVALLEAELSAVGHEVRCALDGAQGIAVASEWAPDVVLCDLQMPGVSGFEVVDTLKEKTPLTPVLIFTDTSDLAAAVEAMRRGAWGYLLKGLDTTALNGELLKALAHRRVMERNHELEVANLRYQRELEQMVEAKTREIARLEAARAQADRLAAMGSFVAGVAHEVNNPLAVIKSNTSFLAAELAAAQQCIGNASELKEAISEIGTCTARIQRIVEGLKRFSWTGTTHEQCEVAPALDEVRLICRERVSPLVTVDWKIDDDAVTIAMPRGDVVLVVSNLVINAVHAIEATGKPGTVSTHVAREGGWVALEVRDTGSGIRPDIVARIFDPFFTTKAPGKGSGLGLSLVRQVVQNAGGTIAVESELGRGSTFRIRVPAETTAPRKTSPEARR